MSLVASAGAGVHERGRVFNHDALCRPRQPVRPQQARLDVQRVLPGLLLPQESAAPDQRPQPGASQGEGRRARRAQRRTHHVQPPPRLASRPACGRGAATCASTDSACLAWDRALQRSTLRDRGSRRVNSGTATPKANTAAARLAKAEKNFKHTDSKKQTIHTEDPQPVTDVANTGDKTYLGTWINEAVVVHKNGRLIRRYMKLKGRQVYSGARMRWLRCGAAVARSTHTRASWCRRHDRLQS